MDISQEKITDILMLWVPKIALAIILLVVGFWLIGRLTGMMKRMMAKRGFDETIQPFLSSLISTLLKVLLLISIAGIFGVPVASFVAIIGAAAFAIGLALQGSLGHFASGVLLLVFKPYRVGDFVEIGDGRVGSVKEIQVFNTIITTLDNQIIYVPNGLVTSNPIKNINQEPKRRVDFTFGIGYDDDIDLARATIQEVADSCPLILKGEANQIEIESHGDSSVNFTTRMWTNTENYWPVYFYMMENVKKKFDEKNIGIPYPQMDVHIQGGQA